jgi:hypothetical protein
MAIKKTITKKVLPKAQKGIVKDSIIKSSWTKKEPTPVYTFNKLDTTSLNNKFSNTMDDKSKSPKIKFKAKSPKIKFKEGGSTPAWTRKEGKNPAGGLNAKGVASYRKENPGSKLKMAVTTKPSKLDPDSKDAKRRKSFCSRMSGMPGPMKDEKGRPTRKALALRKWNC